METAEIIAHRRRNFSKLFYQTGWYHSIELPDGTVTEGVHTLDALKTRVAEFPIPDDLRGKRVLDIGAWDGWFSFEMERRGAEVVAVDCVEIENFQYAHRLLGSKVDYRIMDLMDMSPAVLGTFDIVLLLGVLYHLKHPLLGLEKVCELTRDLAIVDSFVVVDDTTPAGTRAVFPAMEFYETDELGEQLDNWFGPSVECLMALCRTAGFARVELLSAPDERAFVACYRKWEPPPERPGAEAPVLAGLAHARNHGINCYSGRDDYLSCWFESEEQNLTRLNVYPEVGPYGVQPVWVGAGEGGSRMACFKLPPGLERGWHPVRLRTAQSGFSNELRIAVDLAPNSDGLRVKGVSDGLDWTRGVVKLGPNAHLSLWVQGLSENADRDNVQVRLSGLRQQVVYLSEPDEEGFRQVNARVRRTMEPGEHDLSVEHGGARHVEQVVLQS